MIKLTKKTNNLSDEDLVRVIIARKSHEEFGILYDRYSEKVYHKCISFVGESSIAQDLMHDIFLKVFINLSKFNFKSKFSTWLYSISYNFCVDYVRKNNKIRKVNDEELGNLPEDQDDQIEKELLKIRAQKLMETLNQIDPEDKMILLMKYQDDMSIKDLMSVLELKESAVKMKISRARSRAVKQYKTMFPNE